jgi:hypothetical protein
MDSQPAVGRVRPQRRRRRKPRVRQLRRRLRPRRQHPARRLTSRRLAQRFRARPRHGRLRRAPRHRTTGDRFPKMSRAPADLPGSPVRRGQRRQAAPDHSRRARAARHQAPPRVRPPRQRDPAPHARVHPALGITRSRPASRPAWRVALGQAPHVRGTTRSPLESLRGCSGAHAPAGHGLQLREVRARLAAVAHAPEAEPCRRVPVGHAPTPG